MNYVFSSALEKMEQEVKRGYQFYYLPMYEFKKKTKNVPRLQYFEFDIYEGNYAQIIPDHESVFKYLFIMETRKCYKYLSNISMLVSFYMLLLIFKSSTILK